MWYVALRRPTRGKRDDFDPYFANAVYNLSGLEYLVTTGGRSIAWTPYRYAVYLRWMQQTAHTLGVAADMLEATLFRPPTDPMGEDDAAD